MIKQFQNPEINNQNSYLIVKDKKAILIDSASNCTELFAYLDQEEIEILAIVITHGHFDHLINLDKITNKFPNAQVYINEWDYDCLISATRNGSARRNMNLTFTIPSQNLTVLCQTTTIEILELSLLLKHIPGHTPGSQYILINQLDAVFIGDTIFKDNIGFHSIPYCDDDYFKASLIEITQLDDNLTVYPGHHDPFLLGEVKEANKILRDFINN